MAAEYRVETLGGALRAAKPQELEALLNAASEQGWSIADISYKPNTSQLWLVLKREVEQERNRNRRSWMSDWA